MLGTSDELLLIVHEMQSIIYENCECKLASLDFSAALETVILITKMVAVGIYGRVFNILSEFLTKRQQRVVVDGGKF